ncbi:hypothetical protein KEM48_002172 [Puccinia striiformis f. sp. tritici PST-130]|nr:hypothetical protein KEM48_002172 [Puccinia striiformis f. sp. tritici PST-130]
MLSRLLYAKIQAILMLADMYLPAWATVRESRTGILDLLRCKDLANPLVSKHLDYYPEWTDGRNISKFLQSGKWLSGMSRVHRPQMCESNGTHFYIYEPVQLASHAVRSNGNTAEDCISAGPRISQCTIENGPSQSVCRQLFKNSLARRDIYWGGLRGIIYGIDGSVEEEIPFPNPWREKSGNRVIRNVPSTLYSDNTSGNVSKQWNKHISFYFTLSGLPPHISNQEYNCHFLAMSNLASVCEMSEQIVEELNEMSTVGFEASTLPRAKLFGALNPCRSCDLSVKEKKFKKTRTYVEHFLHRNVLGMRYFSMPRPARKWAQTRKQSRALLLIATRKSYKQFTIRCKKYGIKDSITMNLLDAAKKSAVVQGRINTWAKERSHKPFNPILELKGFNGVLDTPVEVLHVVLLGAVKYLARDFIASVSKKDRPELIGRLQSLNLTSLNIDSHKPAYLVNHVKSLVGRDFKILLQAAPFTFFKFMTPGQKLIWSSLCKLAPFIFQTHIEHMTVYLQELKIHINQFLLHIVNHTAQWVNKPKFHMLLHLPEAIERFGPAVLFSTEKFESYNGVCVLRKASVHSNKLAPGRDLAFLFDIFASLWFLLSGRVIYDEATGMTRHIGPNVTSVFEQNHIIQQSMGYNHQAANPLQPDQYPFKTAMALGKSNQIVTPTEVEELDTTTTISQIAQVQINKQDCVHQGVCVVVGQSGRSEQLERTAHVCVLNARWIQGCMNVQHNCHMGKCPVKLTKTTLMEQQETTVKTLQVEHVDHAHYVINSASLHEPQLHQMVSGLAVGNPNEEQWASAIANGFAVWLESGQNITSDEEPRDVGFEAESEDEDADGETDDGEDWACMVDNIDAADEDLGGEGGPGMVVDENETDANNEGGSDPDAEGVTDDGEEYDWDVVGQ